MEGGVPNLPPSNQDLRRFLCIWKFGMQHHTSYSPWLHRVARLTASATFLLIVIGGIVTSTDSGLAVPDWPTTFGYNMFLYPLSEMVGGILYEHSHRLMGSLVGMLTIGLLGLILVKDSANG